MTIGPRLVSERIQVEDSLEAINELLYQRGLTDGLPIVPPTEERVLEMLGGRHLEAQEVVAVLPPAGAEATLEKIAISAVMAGCLPPYLPVVVAAVKAMAEPQFNLYGIETTTNPVAPLAIINGPVRTELDINCGRNCLGQGRRANAAIGRAIRLVLMNIGGSLPGVTDTAVQGMPGKYTFCFGENEETSPWEPLHVERGFDAGVSTVTAVGATGTTNILDGGSQTADGLLRTMAGSMTILGCNHYVSWPPGEPLLVMSPEHASRLTKDGLTKGDVKRALFERTSVPLASYSLEVQERMRQRGRGADGRIYIAERAEDIMIVVAGGPGTHSVFMPSFGNTIAVTKPIL